MSYRINADVPVGTPLVVTGSGEPRLNDFLRHQIAATSATGTIAIDVIISGHTEAVQLNTGWTGIQLIEITNIESITFTATTATVHVTMFGLEEE